MPLFPYQLEAIEGLPKDVILAFDTGTGKGQSSLEHYKRYSLGLPLLIIAPASKAKSGDWERELDMAELSHIPHQIVSYDKFGRSPTKYIDDENFVLIADECHFIKQPTTKRGKATIAAARLSKQFIGLSATPLPGGFKDLVSYMMIWGKVRNITEFRNRFMVIDKSRGFPIILGYREQGVLKDFWNSVAKPLERTMDSTSIGVDIQLKPAQLNEYRRLKKDRTTRDGDLLDNPSKLFSHLRQYSAPMRSDALRSVLDGTNEHVIVFYNFNTERDEILKVLEDYPVEVYEQSGHRSHLPERAVWDTMKPSVTIAQYQSASTAIELQYASVTVYYSPTYSFSDFHQSLGRTKRVGQKKHPVFYMFRVLGTIDEAVWKCIKEKRDFSESVWLVDNSAMDSNK